MFIMTSNKIVVDYQQLSDMTNTGGLVLSQYKPCRCGGPIIMLINRNDDGGNNRHPFIKCSIALCSVKSTFSWVYHIREHFEFVNLASNAIGNHVGHSANELPPPPSYLWHASDGNNDRNTEEHLPNSGSATVRLQCCGPQHRGGSVANSQCDLKMCKSCCTTSEGSCKVHAQSKVAFFNSGGQVSAPTIPPTSLRPSTYVRPLPGSLGAGYHTLTPNSFENLFESAAAADLLENSQRGYDKNKLASATNRVLLIIYFTQNVDPLEYPFTLPASRVLDFGEAELCRLLQELFQPIMRLEYINVHGNWSLATFRDTVHIPEKTKLLILRPWDRLSGWEDGVCKDISTYLNRAKFSPARESTIYVDTASQSPAPSQLSELASPTAARLKRSTYAVTRVNDPAVKKVQFKNRSTMEFPPAGDFDRFRKYLRQCALLGKWHEPGAQVPYFLSINVHKEVFIKVYPELSLDIFRIKKDSIRRWVNYTRKRGLQALKDYAQTNGELASAKGWEHTDWDLWKGLIDGTGDYKDQEEDDYGNKYGSALKDLVNTHEQYLDSEDDEDV